MHANERFAFNYFSVQTEEEQKDQKRSALSHSHCCFDSSCIGDGAISMHADERFAFNYFRIQTVLELERKAAEKRKRRRVKKKK
jgi:hypothetical protein